jgi:hypothetical protein
MLEDGILRIYLPLEYLTLRKYIPITLTHTLTHTYDAGKAFRGLQNNFLQSLKQRERFLYENALLYMLIKPFGRTVQFALISFERW